MRSLRSIAILGILAIGFLAVQPADADAQVLRFRTNYYYDPGPYYYPATTVYYPTVAPYAYPVYPRYAYETRAAYALPGYAPVYGRTVYYGGVAPTYYGPYPYSGVGFYYFRR